MKSASHKAVLGEFGLEVVTHPGCSIPIVRHSDIKKLCDSQGVKFTKAFNEGAMGQTCIEEGMYYYDVADILRTIQTGIEKRDWD
jgi:hypothetical protein